jgi:hypothetical protein
MASKADNFRGLRHSCSSAAEIFLSLAPRRGKRHPAKKGRDESDQERVNDPASRQKTNKRHKTPKGNLNYLIIDSRTCNWQRKIINKFIAIKKLRIKGHGNNQ